MKKFSTPVLILFWSYTWHAYAVSAIGQKNFSPETPPRAVFKQHSPAFQALDEIQGKNQFKRRPFIAKGDIIVLKPIESDEIFYSVEFQIPTLSFINATPSERTHLLRSPPHPI